jgi:glycosyltransferase involved in cell wall biosynthesis
MVVRRHDYDVAVILVFSGASFVLTDVASLLARQLGKLTVLHLHGGQLPELYARRPRWTRRVLARGHLRVAPSSFLQRATEAHGFAVEVVPNLVELPDYQFRTRASFAPRVLWMRAFHDIYGPDVAVRAFAELRRRFPAATLAMAGQDKGTLDATRALVGELGLAEAVRFPGFLDLAGKQREADAADVFLHTSRIDNTPVVLLEAAALGLPIVGTRVGGIPDLVRHEESALLVPVDDHVAMANAIGRLVDEPDLAARLARNGARVAAASAPEPVGQGWECLLGDEAHSRKLS